MPHSYNRDMGSVAMLRRLRGRDVIGPDKWRGPAEADLDMRITSHKCRFCGLPMYPYKDYGNALIWACDNEYCINNPDSKLKNKYDFTGDVFMNTGNTNLAWKNWMPDRII